jgi:hypothetical protein
VRAGSSSRGRDPEPRRANFRCLRVPSAITTAFGSAIVGEGAVDAGPAYNGAGVRLCAWELDGYADRLRVPVKPGK